MSPIGIISTQKSSFFINQPSNNVRAARAKEATEQQWQEHCCPESSHPESNPLLERELRQLARDDSANSGSAGVPFRDIQISRISNFDKYQIVKHNQLSTILILNRCKPLLTMTMSGCAVKLCSYENWGEANRTHHDEGPQLWPRSVTAVNPESSSDIWFWHHQYTESTNIIQVNRLNLILTCFLFYWKGCSCYCDCAGSSSSDGTVVVTCKARFALSSWHDEERQVPQIDEPLIRTTLSYQWQHIIHIPENGSYPTKW